MHQMQNAASSSWVTLEASEKEFAIFQSFWFDLKIHRPNSEIQMAVSLP